MQKLPKPPLNLQLARAGHRRLLDNKDVAALCEDGPVKIVVLGTAPAFQEGDPHLFMVIGVDQTIYFEPDRKGYRVVDEALGEVRAQNLAVLGKYSSGYL